MENNLYRLKLSLGQQEIILLCLRRNAGLLYGNKQDLITEYIKRYKYDKSIQSLILLAYRLGRKI